MRNRKIAIAAVALIAIVMGAGCSGQPLSTREKGTLGGAAIGAGTGAIIGAAVGAPGAGAAIGGALGGVTGYAVGNHMQNTEDANAQTQQQVESQQQQIEQLRQVAGRGSGAVPSKRPRGRASTSCSARVPMLASTCARLRM